MTEKLEGNGVNEVLELTNEFLYERHIMNRGRVRKFLEKTSIPEYIALSCIEAGNVTSQGSVNKIYLKDLTDKMQMPIQEVSAMVEKLSIQELVTWTYDGIGESGTYVMITERGSSLMREQELKLKEYYGKVIEKYGKDKFIQLIQMMKEMEEVTKSMVEITDESENC